MNESELTNYFILKLQRELTSDEKYILYKSFNTGKEFENTRIKENITNMLCGNKVTEE